MCVCVCVCVCSPVCIPPHTRYEDILVAKCVRQRLSSVCVIDCMSCWPNVSVFSLELGEKSVISSKAPLEKPCKPVIAREKAGQPAKPNTWEGIWNIVNSRVTHSLSGPRPERREGRRAGVWGMEGGCRWNIECEREMCADLYSSMMTTAHCLLWSSTRRGTSIKSKREFFFCKLKMQMFEDHTFSHNFKTSSSVYWTCQFSDTSSPAHFLNSECSLWSSLTSFMCWHNIFLVLSNKSVDYYSSATPFSCLNDPSYALPGYEPLKPSLSSMQLCSSVGLFSPPPCFPPPSPF